MSESWIFWLGILTIAIFCIAINIPGQQNKDGAAISGTIHNGNTIVGGKRRQRKKK